MNTMKEDFSKATFKLTMDDLENPWVLMDAFIGLYYEVWRYAEPVGIYYYRLPRGYVENRFMQQLVGDRPLKEKEVWVGKAIQKLRELKFIEVCPATAEYMVVRI